jgi:predicted TIM-barrel fold metal-dependent hydrolase
MTAISRPPSSYLRDGRVFVSCEPEESAIAQVAQSIGIDTIVFASDYPHWDAEFPGSVRAITDRKELTTRQKDAILNDNPRRYLAGTPLTTTALTRSRG